MPRLYKADPDKLLKALAANAEIASAYAQALERLLSQVEGRDVKRAFKTITPESTYPCGFIYGGSHECIHVRLDPKVECQIRERYGKEGEGAISCASGAIHFADKTPEGAIRRELDAWSEAARSWRELSEPSRIGRIAARHDEALAILQEIDALKLPQSVSRNGWILPIFGS